MHKRYIKIKMLEERKSLENLYKNSDKAVVRRRSQAILLSSRGYDIEQLSEIFEVKRSTIGKWFDRWEEQGVEGLYDRSKSGRPSHLTLEEQKKHLSPRLLARFVVSGISLPNKVKPWEKQ